MHGDALVLEQAAVEVVTAYLDGHDPRYLAEDVTVEVVADGRTWHGRAAAAALGHDLRHRLFGDVEEVVTGVYGAGSVVAAELSFTGRPVDSSGQHAAHDQPVTVRAAAVFRVTGGEISSTRIYFDTCSLRHAAGTREQRRTR
ncbi:MAG TPA: nuclear transport factor 2 family protein [Mycobacteriales bacterium]|jgi:ketosteroid isomerase-like protein|nr:nuclear transport factor 2 family protein [Mycobacteriales bacterium]